MPESSTILLVEDEPHLRDVVARVLTASGYVVLDVGTGEEALRIAESHPELAAIVTDIRLPDMYGRRLAGRVADVRGPEAAPLGVVYVSGNVEEVTNESSMRPRERFVAKPFEFADLLATLAQVLAER